MVSHRGGKLEVIQRAYDLILWEVPLVTRFAVPYRAVLGDRIQTTLYPNAGSATTQAARRVRFLLTVLLGDAACR